MGEGVNEKAIAGDGVGGVEGDRVGLASDRPEVGLVVIEAQV